MKKRISFMLVVMVATTLLLSACGKDMSDSKYLGKWEAISAEYSGVEISVDTLYDAFYFTLQDNGTVKLTLNDEEHSGKWDETDSGIIIDDEMEFKEMDDDILTYESDGATVYFVRE